MKDLKSMILFFALISSDRISAMDSLKIKSPKEIILTSRMFSAGHFPFTGALLNHHINADFNLYYNKENKGFFIYKALDFEDFNSDLNYLQAGAFRRMTLSKKLSFTPYLGYVFLQTKSFSDNGSDVFMALQPTFQSKNWTIENTALFQNVLQLGYKTTLGNRMEIKYAIKTASISGYFWHNITLAKNAPPPSLSTAILIRSPMIALAKRIPMQATVMFQTFLTDYKPSYALRRGVVFSLNFPLNLVN